jgi:hypothetical protein
VSTAEKRVGLKRAIFPFSFYASISKPSSRVWPLRVTPLRVTPLPFHPRPPPSAKAARAHLAGRRRCLCKLNAGLRCEPNVLLADANGIAGRRPVAGIALRVIQNRVDVAYRQRMWWEGECWSWNLFLDLSRIIIGVKPQRF